MQKRWGRNRGWICVLPVVPILLILAGCSHEPKPSKVDVAKGILDDIRAGVREEIKDPGRASEAVGLVDQMEQMIMEASEARKAHEARIVSLNANYDATEEDFKAVFREFNAKKNSRQDRLVGVIQQAKALTTAAEWKAIAKVKAHALEAAVHAELGR